MLCPELCSKKFLALSLRKITIKVVVEAKELWCTRFYLAFAIRHCSFEPCSISHHPENISVSVFALQKYRFEITNSLKMPSFFTVRGTLSASIALIWLFSMLYQSSLNWILSSRYRHYLDNILSAFFWVMLFWEFNSFWVKAVFCSRWRGCWICGL